MDLIEAIRSRRSIRGYKPELVPDEVVREILDVARWAPSGVNKQSWEFIVLSGKLLDMVREANVKELELGTEKHPYMPSVPLSGPYKQRQVELAKELFQLAGIERHNEEQRREWVKSDLRFFDAPMAILVCSDKEVPEPRATFEAGIVTQTVALAAMHFGLGSCVMVAPVEFPEVIYRVAEIPSSKRLYCAIALGYPDWNNPVNKLRSSREPVERLTIWRSSHNKKGGSI
jgi:nitroreductase